MKVKISTMDNFVELCKKDETERCIGYYKLNNISLTGRNSYYPNVLLYQSENGKLMNPYDEMVMSLGKKSFYEDDYDIENSIIDSTYQTPVFFFYL